MLRACLLVSLATAAAFVPAAHVPRHATHTAATRRDWLEGMTAAAASATVAFSNSLPAFAGGKPRVVVVGGTGFVGSEVVRQLAAGGADVVSVSRRGGGGGGASDYIAGDALAPSASWFKGADAVVSCVGTIGSSDDAQGNGATNAALAKAASAAGAKSFVYVSVASQVGAAVGGVLPAYFEGKAEAERAGTLPWAPPSPRLLAVPSPFVAVVSPPPPPP